MLIHYVVHFDSLYVIIIEHAEGKRKKNIVILMELLHRYDGNLMVKHHSMVLLLRYDDNPLATD